MSNNKQYRGNYAKKLNPGCENCGSVTARTYRVNKKSLCKKCSKKEQEMVTKLPDTHDDYVMALRKHYKLPV